MHKLPDTDLYTHFSYHVALLNDFADRQAGGAGSQVSRKHRQSIRTMASKGEVSTHSLEAHRAESMRQLVHRKSNTTSGGKLFRQVTQ